MAHGLAAERNALEAARPEVDLAVADAVGHRVVPQLGVLEAGLVRGLQRHEGGRPGVEQGGHLVLVQLYLGPDRRACLRGAGQQFDHGDGRVPRPVRHVGLVAVIAGLDQPDHAVRQVVFGVEDAQDVAAQQAHPAQARIVAAHQELDARELGVLQLHLPDCGLARVDHVACQALHPESVGQRLQPQSQLFGRGPGQVAEERAAVDHHRDLRAVDAQHGDRARPVHSRRQFHHLDPAHRMRRCGRREQERAGRASENVHGFAPS